MVLICFIFLLRYSFERIIRKCLIMFIILLYKYTYFFLKILSYNDFILIKLSV